jgi:DNA-directed RNA polymerase specialized sigma24 family protein
VPDRPDFLDKKRGFPATAAEFERHRRQVRQQLGRRYAAGVIEDAVAEATQALLRRHSSGESLRDWKAYFYACAAHAAAALQREEARRRRAEQERSVERGSDQRSARENAARTPEELRRMVSRLPPADRELLTAWANSKTALEAARALGLSRSTFYARLRNILDRLRARRGEDR